MVIGHSFIPDIYIAPLQETYTELLSVQLRPKRNVLRSLQKEDTLSRGSTRSVGGNWGAQEQRRPEAVKAQSGPEDPRTRPEPKNEELEGKLNPNPAYSDQSSKMG